MGLKWDDVEDIAIELADAHAGVDACVDESASGMVPAGVPER